jgi:hypothetical protein
MERIATIECAVSAQQPTRPGKHRRHSEGACQSFLAAAGMGRGQRFYPLCVLGQYTRGKGFDLGTAGAT